MRKNNIILLVLVFSLIIISGCGDPDVCKNSKEFKVPLIEPVDSKGWEAYSSPIILNEETVIGLV